MSQFHGNIHFVAVARLSFGNGIIMTSHSYNTETDLNAVKQVLEQPNMSLNPGKHYSFSVNNTQWHIIADDSALIYIMISKFNYPQRVAHAALEELQRSFMAKAGDKASTAKDKALDKTCGSILLRICEKYDNLAEVDKLASVSRKVDTVKLVMQENVDLALKNCVKLESIERAADDLQQQAGVFKRSAHDLKKKMWWKNIKMYLIIGFIVLAIVGIIAGVVAYMVEQNKKKNN